MPAFPILLGDIGGTNARFALLKAPGEIELLPKVLTAEHADPVAAIQASLATSATSAAARSAILAVAAPITGPCITLTNADWTIDAGAIGSALGLDAVTLVNDFVPVAAACAVLGRDRLEPLGPERVRGGGTRVVLGPGTGLGAAALIPVDGGRWLIQPTEAGHVEFGPVREHEARLWPALERVGGRVTSEVVLSGPGLHRLYRAVCATGGQGARCASPAEVVESAGAAEPAAAKALQLYAELLGRFAGDLALIFQATGGVFLAGGVAPRIAGALRSGAFRQAFDAKAPFADLMAGLPVWLITDPEPALSGLGALATEEGRFLHPSAGWRKG